MSVAATLGTDVPGGNIQAEQKFFRAIGTLAFSSNYAAGGDALSFAGVLPIPNLSPVLVRIQGLGACRYLYVKSTGKAKVITGEGGGLTAYAQSDIKGSAAANVPIAGGALPTNGGLISNLADAANTTAFTLALQPDIPRNIGVAFKNTNAGASTGNAVNVVIVGTYRGAAQTETIAFTALELTSTAQNEVATKYGSKPFDRITSITPSAAQPANWQHAAGVGSKIGLPALLANGAEADLIKLTKNAADLAITGTADGTNNTVNFGVLADGDDISAEYNALNGAAELAAGAYPSYVTGDTITFEALFPKV